MEFQVQSVYLIYTRLLVYTTLILAYPKSHILHVIDIWDNTIVSEPSMFFCVTFDRCVTSC